MGLRIYGTIVVEVSAQVVRCRTAIAGNLSARETGLEKQQQSVLQGRVPAIKFYCGKKHSYTA